MALPTLAKPCACPSLCTQSPVVDGLTTSGRLLRQLLVLQLRGWFVPPPRPPWLPWMPSKRGRGLRIAVCRMRSNCESLLNSDGDGGSAEGGGEDDSPAPAAAAGAEAALDVAKLSVPSLRTVLQMRGLDSSGLKAVLAARLTAANAAASSTCRRKRSGTRGGPGGCQGWQERRQRSRQRSGQGPRQERRQGRR